jgi:ABC-type glycerol-3-phosphate transport system substrate-binding protein
LVERGARTGRALRLSRFGDPGTVGALQFWPRWTSPFQVDGLAKLLALYNEQAPEVTVQMTPHGAQYEKIVAAVSGGTSPDVVTVIGRFALRKAVQPLDGLLARSKTAGKDVFFPAQLETATWTGQVYGLPAFDNGPSPFLFWNPSPLQDGGLDAGRPPATPEDARHDGGQPAASVTLDRCRVSYQ